MSLKYVAAQSLVHLYQEMAGMRQAIRVDGPGAGLCDNAHMMLQSPKQTS